MRANEILDEGWRDWAASAALGAAALGGISHFDKAKEPEKNQAAVQAIKQGNVAKEVQVSTPIEKTLVKYAQSNGINGQELAQFLAQVKHESWDFSKLKEKPQPGVKNYFKKKYDISHAPKTAKILGNKKVGDGEKYHGRGYIQLTGRDNYRMAGAALKLPLLENPELASEPAIAAKIAVWYWNTRVKPHVQDFTDTASVTKKINPAMHGLAGRVQNFKNYLSTMV